MLLLGKFKRDRMKLCRADESFKEKGQVLRSESLDKFTNWAIGVRGLEKDKRQEEKAAH